MRKQCVIYPPIEELRPTKAQAFLRALVYLLRNATLCSLVTTVFTAPFFYQVYLPLPVIRHLPPVLLFLVTFQFLCHALPWFTFNAFYLLLDSVHPEFGFAPGWRDKYPLLRELGDYFAQFKLTRRPMQIPSQSLILRTIGKVFVEQYMVTPLLGYVFFNYVCPVAPEDMMPNPHQPLIGLSDKHHSTWFVFLSLIPHFVLANLLNEVGFFLVHGFVHYNSWLYRTFHKQHHEYTGTISIAAEYASVTEEVFANTLPSVGYFFYFFFAYTNAQVIARRGAVGGDASQLWLESARAWPLAMTWMWARLWETYESHSGYCFSDTTLGKLGLLHGHRARFHDFHHTHNLSNYGSGIIMDALCDTMDPYLKHTFARRIKDSVDKHSAEKSKRSTEMIFPMVLREHSPTKKQQQEQKESAKKK
ncbi:Fatty acid hydroxylase superfamily, putative [Angomonas deanei]|uniref:Fatty acid hydroxylase superfamily, putative n=1 Tax=Angomonas deanei TaxID=59799 RepID=A0A7G2C3K8_9TRYP|nr:Fatty acid hydroxylase superfamily, putative [Angomonas deanei]